MSNKKSSKRKNNNFPYSNELKKAKDEFIKMICEMSDIEFLLFSSAFAEFVEDYYMDDFEENDYFNETLDDEDLPF